MANPIFTWPDRRHNDPAHDQLAAFLVMDIQQSPDWAEDLLEQIEAIESGDLATWERIGNAFRLELSVQGATLEDLVDEAGSIQQVPLGEFRAAVLAWYQQTAGQESQ